MTLAELDFGQTVVASLLNALFTALLVGLVAGFVVKRYEDLSARSRQALEQRHEERLQASQLEYQERLQAGQLEYQTRAALRDTYTQLLVAQRRSREASLKLAGDEANDQTLLNAAVDSHDQFTDLYHRLNLDASDRMWRDARALRHVLDDLLNEGRDRNVPESKRLAEVARAARQNLEISFRLRLDHNPLQERRDLRRYNK